MPVPDSAPTPARDAEPDQYLDGSMTRNDLVEVLESLPFRRVYGRDRDAGPTCRLVSIDIEVRDYLVSALRRA